MQDKLNANLSKGNFDSSSVKTLRTIFKSIVKNRAYLLELAEKLDATTEIQGEGGEVTIQDLLAREIPIFITLKTTQSKVCELMVGMWLVLQAVIANVTLHRDATYQLEISIEMQLTSLRPFSA
jgi:hypothetical protein